MPSFARGLIAFCAALSIGLGAVPMAFAQQGPSHSLRKLQTGDDSRGWEAVGRLNFGSRGFCTGTLISEDLVLTAAHCLFDRETGVSQDPEKMQFLAGWRNGRAAAYRGVSRVIAHPEYVYGGHDTIERVAFDLALIELDQPIRLPSIRPFATDIEPRKGDEVGVVSYAQDRAEVPSLQQLCHVIAGQPTMLVLSCDIDFGSSGAPIFSAKDGVLKIVSVVSAKAELNGKKVALGTPLAGNVEMLRRDLGAGRGRNSNVKVLSGGNGGTFIRP